VERFFIIFIDNLDGKEGGGEEEERRIGSSYNERYN
jgi:hypothetical protein